MNKYKHKIKITNKFEVMEYHKTLFGKGATHHEHTYKLSYQDLEKIWADTPAPTEVRVAPQPTPAPAQPELGAIIRPLDI